MFMKWVRRDTVLVVSRDFPTIDRDVLSMILVIGWNLLPLLYPRQRTDSRSWDVGEYDGYRVEDE